MVALGWSDKREEVVASDLALDVAVLSGLADGARGGRLARARENSEVVLSRCEVF